MFAPFFAVFGWKAAGLVTFGALLRRYKGWRPPWLNGEVILPMTRIAHVASMFVLSLCLLAIPLGGHYLLDMSLAWEWFAGLAAVISGVYWLIIGKLGRIHHEAELVTGILITAVSAAYFAGLIG